MPPVSALAPPGVETLYNHVASYTLLSREHCYFLASLAAYASHLQGNFAECGVYRGGSALLLCKVLQKKSKVLDLFDSFKGLPKIHQEKDRWFTEGEFKEASVEDVEKCCTFFDR